MEQKLFFSLDVQEVLYTSTAATVLLFHISADNGDTMDYLAIYSGHEHLISYVTRPKCCTAPLRFVEFTTCYVV